MYETMYECTDKLILETILQDKFSYFKAEERGVAVATATDDKRGNKKFRRKIVQESTCWYTRIVIVMRIMHLKQYPVPALYSQVRKKKRRVLRVCSKSFMCVWCTVKADSCHNSISTVQLKGGLSHVHM